MRVVIDTNVLVSAVLKDRNPERIILFVAENSDVQWIVSPPIVEEYQTVLSRQRFKLTDELLSQWYSRLDQLCTMIEVPPDIPFPRDQKDSKFITCALASDADFFVTGDRDFDSAYKLMGTTILSVAMFAKMIIDSSSSK